MMLLPGRLAGMLQDGIVATTTPVLLAGRTGRLVTRISLDGDVVQRLELPPLPGAPRLGIASIARAIQSDPGFVTAAATHQAAVRLALIEKASQARALGLRLRAAQLLAMLLGGWATLRADLPALPFALPNAALVDAALAALPWLAPLLQPLAAASVAGLAALLLRLVVRRQLRRALARWTGTDPRHG
jgi:hypothetical protein